MDALDEKANGGPPMEVEEVVSVHDRNYRPCPSRELRSLSRLSAV